MVLHSPDRKQSLLAALTILGFAVLSGGFALAARTADASEPPQSSRTLQIVLNIPPEPVLAPRPAMQVLPLDASQAFDLGAYRHQLAVQRAEAEAARVLAAAPQADWIAADFDRPSPEPLERWAAQDAGPAAF